MTVNDVEQRVEEIRKCAWDLEAAHAKEDALYRDLLESIANGSCDNPIGCAAVAYCVRFIDFERHCA